MINNAFNKVYRNATPSELIEQAIKRQEGLLNKDGSFCVFTGKFTGRAAEDKFIVLDQDNIHLIDWRANKCLLPEDFAQLQARMEAYLQGKDAFIQEAIAAPAARKYPIHIVTTHAWAALFFSNMFMSARLTEEESKAGFTILHCPKFLASPAIDHTRSEAFIVINYAKRIALIGGTEYAGEIKKTVFTALNFLFPKENVLPLHSSVNVGKEGSAIFFGLSGTGKTSLSSDSSRYLIGDDEHGWGDEGLFNFEDGCYAKVINLSQEKEPDIWQAVKRYGTVLENVVTGKDREPDFANNTLTENTRAAYKLSNIANSTPQKLADHPKNIFMLTCDAYGVLPPLSKLTTEQAVYYFLNGYTAKIAGTEAGVKEPKATFSACFGAPFLPLPAVKYAEMLRERIIKHNTNVWLVNTGWINGPYGVGERISIHDTRRFINYVLDGVEPAKWETFPVFDLQVPIFEEIPQTLSIPRWSDIVAYEQAVIDLFEKFKTNYKKYKS